MDDNCALLQQDLEGGQDFRIVLVGKSGTGKSASANTIVRFKAFNSKTSASAVTTECQKEISSFAGKKLVVVDTPGLFDGIKTMEEVRREIAECISFAAPGPHVFLIVLQLDRFTKEEQDTVKIIQETFGTDARRYTMALFTRGGDLDPETDMDTFIGESKALSDFISQCDGGYHVFEKNKEKDPSQVRLLLKKIELMVQMNGESYYSCDMFQEAERAIRKEEERLLRENPSMSREEAIRQAEKDNEFIKGFLAAAAAAAAVGAGVTVAKEGIKGAAMDLIAAVMPKDVNKRVCIIQ